MTAATLDDYHLAAGVSNGGAQTPYSSTTTSSTAQTAPTSFSKFHGPPQTGLGNYSSFPYPTPPATSQALPNMHPYSHQSMSNGFQPGGALPPPPAANANTNGRTDHRNLTGLMYASMDNNGAGHNPNANNTSSLLNSGSGSHLARQGPSGMGHEDHADLASNMNGNSNSNSNSNGNGNGNVGSGGSRPYGGYPAMDRPYSGYTGEPNRQPYLPAPSHLPWSPPLASQPGFMGMPPALDGNHDAHHQQSSFRYMDGSLAAQSAAGRSAPSSSRSAPYNNGSSGSKEQGGLMDSTGGLEEDHDNRTRNAKAQKRHREKRKAHVRSLEEMVSSLQDQLRMIRAGTHPDFPNNYGGGDQNNPLLTQNEYLRKENAKLRDDLEVTRRKLAEFESGISLSPRNSTSKYTNVKNESSVGMSSGSPPRSFSRSQDFAPSGALPMPGGPSDSYQSAHNNEFMAYHQEAAGFYNHHSAPHPRV